MPFSSDQQTLLTTLDEQSRKLGIPAYLVGGIVRDLLLGLPVRDRDIDCLIDGSAEQFATAVSQVTGGEVVGFPKFLTAKITRPSALPSIAEIDFASARTEVYDRPGALPRVAGQTSIDNDLLRRDFTVNAIAVPIASVAKSISAAGSSSGLGQFAITAPQALADLEQRKIRILHAASFNDDGSRIVRAIRYQLRLNGSIEAETDRQFDAAVGSGALLQVDGFRLRAELQRTLTEVDGGVALRRFEERGVLAALKIADLAGVERESGALTRLSLLNRAEVKQAVWPVLYAAAPAATRADVFQALGFSKKRIAEFEEVIGCARAHLTDLGAIGHLAAAARLYTGEEWTAFSNSDSIA